MTDFEALIVIRARLALVSGSQILFEKPEEIGPVRFFFEDGFITDTVEDWYSLCLVKGVKDFKLSDEGRHIHDGLKEDAYGQDRIVCLWKDGRTTVFKSSWFEAEGRLGVGFFEEVYTGDTSKLYHVLDNSAEFRDNLWGFIHLLGKIRCDVSRYKVNFGKAIIHLFGRTQWDLDVTHWYLQGIGKRLQGIMFARDYVSVFGDKESWIEKLHETCREWGLEEEYNRLTNDLTRNLRKSLLYVANCCDKN